MLRYPMINDKVFNITWASILYVCEVMSMPELEAYVQNAKDEV